MQTPPSTRLLSLAALAAGLALAAAGCQGNTSSVAGSTGPSSQSDTRSSGVGPGGHQSASNNATHGPSNAGPAGSQ